MDERVDVVGKIDQSLLRLYLRYLRIGLPLEPQWQVRLTVSARFVSILCIGYPDNAVLVFDFESESALKKTLKSLCVRGLLPDALDNTLLLALRTAFLVARCRSVFNVDSCLVPRATRCVVEYLLKVHVHCLL